MANAFFIAFQDKAAAEIEKQNEKRKTIRHRRFSHWQFYQSGTDATRAQHHLAGFASGLLARESI